MYFDAEAAHCGQDIVNLFAKHFASTYKVCNEGVPDYDFNYSIDLDFVSITLADVFEAITSLETRFSHGPDGIPSVLVKRCVCTLSKPLQHIFNLS